MQNLDLSTATLTELFQAHTKASIALAECIDKLGTGDQANLAVAKETALDMHDIADALTSRTTKPSEPIELLLALHQRASHANQNFSKRVERITEYRTQITEYIAPAPRDELRALQAQRALELGDLPRSTPHANDARIEEIITEYIA
jgi:Na+/phosphate symporter